MKSLRTLAALAVALLCLAHACTALEPDEMALESVDTLVFRAGRPTTSRNSRAVDQLACRNCDDVDPSKLPTYAVCGDLAYHSPTCVFHPEDGHEGYRFVDVEMNCEGYSDRDDPNVLEGSCGLLYSMESTGIGFWGMLLLWALLVLIVCMVWYRCKHPLPDNQQSPHHCCHRNDSWWWYFLLSDSNSSSSSSGSSVAAGAVKALVKRR